MCWPAQYLEACGDETIRAGVAPLPGHAKERIVTSLATAGVRGALAALASQGTSLVGRLASVIVLAHLLIPEYFGLVAIVAAFAEFSAGVIDFGLPLAVAQADALSARAKSTLFFVNFLLGLGFAVVFLLAADAIASLYGDQRLSDIIRWLSLIPLAVGISAQSRAQLMTELRFVSIEVINTGTRLIGMAAAVVVAAITGSISSLIILAVVPPLAALPLFLLTAKWFPGRPGSWIESRRVLAIGARIFGLNLLRDISRTAIVPVLGLTETTRNVGFYDRAYQLSATPANALMDSLQRITVPILSRARSDSSRLQKSYEKVQTTVTISLVTGIWVVGALGEPLVVVALGDKWRFTGELMQLLAIAAGFRLLGTMQMWLFVAGRATGAGLIFSAWAQPLVIAISLCGLPWGVVGVAITNVIAWAAFWPICTVAAAKATGLCGKRILTNSLAVVASFSAPVAVLAALPRLLPLNSVLLIVAGTATALVAAGILVLLRPSLRSALNEVITAALNRQRQQDG